MIPQLYVVQDEVSRLFLRGHSRVSEKPTFYDKLSIAKGRRTAGNKCYQLYRPDGGLPIPGKAVRFVVRPLLFQLGDPVQ